MTINAALNLVFPVRMGDVPDPDKPGETKIGPLVWAYHIPISREIFEANYRVITATQLELAGKGSIALSIAGLELRNAERQEAALRGEDDVPNPSPLLAEITRSTMVIAPGPQGFDAVPVTIAMKQGVIDAEDWKEALDSLVFFTCGLSIQRRAHKEAVAKSYASVLRGSITSLSATAYGASLATSTTAETLAVEVQSSMPS